MLKDAYASIEYVCAWFNHAYAYLSMCTHLEPKLGKKSYFYVFNHFTCYLIMFDSVCVNYLCLIIYHVCLSLFAMFGLFYNLSLCV